MTKGAELFCPAVGAHLLLNKIPIQKIRRLRMKRQHYIRIRSIIAGQHSIGELSPPFALPQRAKFFVSLKKTFLNRKRFFLFKIYTPQHGLRDGGWLRLNPSERQSAIMDILRRERHTTTARLSTEFDVTERTIRNDITALSLTLPILTVRGRYGGGIKLADWFRPCAKTLSPKQEELLHRLKTTLAGDDLIVLNSILVQFSLSGGCQ